MKNKTYIGALAVVVAALLWSLDGIFLRPNLHTLPSTLVVFLEHLLGFIVLTPFLIMYAHEMKWISKKQWGAIFWVSLFGGALGTTFITKALFLTGFKDVSVVILLQKIQPIFAIILASIFLRERFPKRFYAYAILAVISGYFVAFKDPLQIMSLPATTFLTILFALLAAFSWGSSTVFGKYSLKNINHGLLAALRFGLTALLMLIPAIFFSQQAWLAIEARHWLILVTVVFTSGSTAIFLYYWGLKKIPASIATLCELSWPVSALLFDYFFNHNVLSPTQIIGAVVLVFVVYKSTALVKSHHITGTVIEGKNKGKEVDMQTANLLTTRAGKLPKGLYTCAVTWEGHSYQGLLYYGYNSLSGEDCLETHILNFSGDIYGKNIKVKTDKYLRLPKKFKNIKDLMERTKKDLELIKKI